MAIKEFQCGYQGVGLHRWRDLVVRKQKPRSDEAQAVKNGCRRNGAEQKTIDWVHTPILTFETAISGVDK